MNTAVLPTLLRDEADVAAETAAKQAAQQRTQEDLESMDRAKLGDRDAFTSLFYRYAAQLKRMAYLMLHDQDAAEDAVQETFERCIAAVQTFRAEGSPHAWLSSIAMNVCRHHLRAARHGVETGEEDLLDRGRRIGKARSRGILTGAVLREDLRQLSIALGFLTQAQREVFVLHYQDDLPYEEIGRILDIRPGAARALAHRAKATLRKQFSDDQDN